LVAKPWEIAWLGRGLNKSMRAWQHTTAAAANHRLASRKEERRPETFCTSSGFSSTQDSLLGSSREPSAPFRAFR
jgi:hypothetical protein